MWFPTITNRNAFTLIELIAVISLVSITLFFVAPRMENPFSGSQTRMVSKWISSNVNELRARSIQRQEEWILYIDMDRNRFGIATTSMDNDSMDAAFFPENGEGREKGLDLPQGFRLTSVRFPGEKQQSGGTVALRFYPEGHADRAIIHMTDRRNRTKAYRVEAFLPGVTILDDHARF